MNHPKNIREFIQKNKILFWHIPPSKIESISLDVLVEYVLNYGDYDTVKELLELLGTDTVAEIFYKNTQQKNRINYNKQNLHFFQLYFDRHASRDIKQRAKRASATYQSV